MMIIGDGTNSNFNIRLYCYTNKIRCVIKYCIKISNQGVDCPLILFVSNADCNNCLKLYSRKIAPTLVLHGYHFVILHYFMARLHSMQVREITPFYC